VGAHGLGCSVAEAVAGLFKHRAEHDLDLDLDLDLGLDLDLDLVEMI